MVVLTRMLESGITLFSLAFHYLLQAHDLLSMFQIEAVQVLILLDELIEDALRDSESLAEPLASLLIAGRPKNNSRCSEFRNELSCENLAVVGRAV